MCDSQKNFFEERKKHEIIERKQYQRRRDRNREREGERESETERERESERESCQNHLLFVPNA